MKEQSDSKSKPSNGSQGCNHSGFKKKGKHKIYQNQISNTAGEFLEEKHFILVGKSLGDVCKYTIKEWIRPDKVSIEQEGSEALGTELAKNHNTHERKIWNTTWVSL